MYQSSKEITSPRLGLTEDLSLGGMKFSPSSYLAPGEPVSVTMRLPELGEVTLRGIVVWSHEAPQSGQGYEAGLRWSDVSPVVQAKLNAFISNKTEPTVVREPQINVEEPISWSRAVVLGVGVFSAMAILALTWMNYSRLTTQINSLQNQVNNYEEQVEYLQSLMLRPQITSFTESDFTATL